jgi:hypothetical protein
MADRLIQRAEDFCTYENILGIADIKVTKPNVGGKIA